MDTLEELLEKLEIVILTCDLGILSHNKSIKKRSRLLLNKAIGVKHSVLHEDLTTEELNALNFLMISWAKESSAIQQSNPMDTNSSSSESERL